MIRETDRHLIHLLASLQPAEWDLPTVASHWTVRDVAAHLLDTALRKLSMARDQCFVEQVALHSNQDLIHLVNRLNREGVAVYRRLSPPVLTQFMQLACTQSADYHESLDPFATAGFGVSWAGETTSLVWFDNARELSERWHHQQQIRLATDRPGILIRPLYHPVLDTFLRGLPYTFRNVPAASGTAVLIEVSGGSGGRWCLRCGPSNWAFTDELPIVMSASITIPEAIAWRVFTRGIAVEHALPQLTFQGDRRLAGHVLQLTAVVA